jgi:hypothetical protein
MNSIMAYVIAHVITWPRDWSFELVGPPYEPLLRGTILLSVYWLILWVMYRRRIFVKI